MNLPVTNVARCTSRNAKTIRLKHLQLHRMGAGGVPPDGVLVVHYWTDQQLVQQNFVLIWRPLFVFRRGPSTPSLLSALFLT